MSQPNFDRNWQLADLLNEAQAARFGQSLAVLMGGDCAISDGQKTVWGCAAANARSAPVAVELEPIAYLHSVTASSEQLQAGAALLQGLLQAQVRFRMASALHLEAIAEDYESLKREHACLIESENRYRQLAGELDARVKAQVAQLEERQQMLYEAEKLASVGRLAAGMAHEINNPLGFLRSNLNSLSRYLEKFDQLHTRLAEGEAAWTALDLDFILSDAQDLLRESDQGLERITRIVSNLKAFSNVDRSSEEFADLNDCIREAAKVIEHQLPAGINLKLDLLPMPAMVCLPGHINQALFNILHNAVQAIEATGQGGTVAVSSEATDEGLFIRIHDNGNGMSGEQLEHALEPFYTTRSVGSGTGLGLTSAHSIVTAHSGKLTLESQPGVGTTVTLFFPSPP